MVAVAVGSHEYLFRFHVFVLANILRRPIVVIADSFLRAANGEPFAPLPMRGLYLPTLVDKDDRSKVPVMIAYTVNKGSQGHFTALVGVDGLVKVVPLEDEAAPLPTPYAEGVTLLEYFDVVTVPYAGRTVMCARLPAEPFMIPESYQIRESLLRYVGRRDTKDGCFC